MTRHSLDARGLMCPLPVIRTQQQVADLPPGDILEVVCTDPGVMEDIPAWCRVNGHTVVEVLEREEDILVILEVGDHLVDHLI